MNRFDKLIYKYKYELCNREELEELLNYLASGNHELELQAAIERQLDIHADNLEAEEKETDAIFENIKSELAFTETKPNVKRLWWLSTAAAILIIGSFAIHHFYNSQVKPLESLQAANKAKSLILPGGNRAILTLANGETISLTNASNGRLAEEGDISVTKTKDGQLVYAPQNGESNGDNAASLNVITIPRGGMYNLVLADGTRVWLNSGSSLTFPSSFTEPERRVQLTGEAYFEVAHNGKPFKVITATQTVQVLGTHFNIEAYQDEPAVKTTLLEGSVKVLRNSEKILLIPGQMSVNKATDPLYVKKANITEVMAWKDGLFIFDNESIAEVMRKAARWYDVEVRYENNVEEKKLFGTVSRYKTIDELLDNIALASKTRYKIEGRRVIFMK